MVRMVRKRELPERVERAAHELAWLLHEGKLSGGPATLMRHVEGDRRFRSVQDLAHEVVTLARSIVRGWKRNPPEPREELSMATKMERIREWLFQELGLNPDLTAEAAYDRLPAELVDGMQLTSFKSNYYTPIRKKWEQARIEAPPRAPDDDDQEEEMHQSAVGATEASEIQRGWGRPAASEGLLEEEQDDAFPGGDEQPSTDGQVSTEPEGVKNPTEKSADRPFGRSPIEDIVDQEQEARDPAPEHQYIRISSHRGKLEAREIAPAVVWKIDLEIELTTDDAWELLSSIFPHMGIAPLD